MDGATVAAFDDVTQTLGGERIERRRLITLDWRRLGDGGHRLAHRMPAIALGMLAMAAAARLVADILHLRAHIFVRGGISQARVNVIYRTATRLDIAKLL